MPAIFRLLRGNWKVKFWSERELDAGMGRAGVNQPILAQEYECAAESRGSRDNLLSHPYTVHIHA